MHLYPFIRRLEVRSFSLPKISCLKFKASPKVFLHGRDFCSLKLSLKIGAYSVQLENVKLRKLFFIIFISHSHAFARVGRNRIFYFLKGNELFVIRSVYHYRNTAIGVIGDFIAVLAFLFFLA